MFANLTAELLELRGASLGRTRASFAVTWDCCSCSSCCCTPFPFCVLP